MNFLGSDINSTCGVAPLVRPLQYGKVWGALYGSVVWKDVIGFAYVPELELFPSLFLPYNIRHPACTPSKQDNLRYEGNSLRKAMLVLQKFTKPGITLENKFLASQEWFPWRYFGPMPLNCSCEVPHPPEAILHVCTLVNYIIVCPCWKGHAHCSNFTHGYNVKLLYAYSQELLHGFQTNQAWRCLGRRLFMYVHIQSGSVRWGLKGMAISY